MKKITETNPYDFIPARLLQGAVLELGMGSGQRQLESNNSELFQKCNYLGVDLHDNTSSLPSMQGDIFDLSFSSNTFDTVLMINVIEHLDITKWNVLFTEIKKWLVEDGTLFLTTITGEEARVNHPHGHVVFGIVRSTFKQALPSCEINTYHHPHLYREPGENRFKSALRLIKRVLTDHVYYNFILTVEWRNDS
jgi:SAM-dependent methyltransferase